MHRMHLFLDISLVSVNESRDSSVITTSTHLNIFYREWYRRAVGSFRIGYTSEVNIVSKHTMIFQMGTCCNSGSVFRSSHLSSFNIKQSVEISSNLMRIDVSPIFHTYVLYGFKLFQVGVKRVYPMFCHPNVRQFMLKVCP